MELCHADAPVFRKARASKKEQPEEIFTVALGFTDTPLTSWSEKAAESKVELTGRAVAQVGAKAMLSHPCCKRVPLVAAAE